MDLNINAFIRTRFWACPTVLGRGATGIASPHVVSTPEWLVAINWVVTRWSWERLLQYWWDVGTLHVTVRMGGWTLQIHILEACTFQIFPFHKSGHTCQPCILLMIVTILLLLYAEIFVLSNSVAEHSNYALKYIAFFFQLSPKMLRCYCCTILIGMLANFGQQNGHLRITSAITWAGMEEIVILVWSGRPPTGCSRAIFTSYTRRCKIDLSLLFNCENVCSFKFHHCWESMKLQYFNYDIGNSRDRMSGFLRQSLRDATPDTLVWSLHLTFSVFSLSPSSGSSPAVVKPNTRFSCHTRKDQGKLQHKEILFDGNANVSEAEKRGQFHNFGTFQATTIQSSEGLWLYS